jgi:hypothetical protein
MTCPATRCSTPRLAALWLCAAVLYACSATPPAPPAPAPPATPQPAPRTLPAADDWRSLLPVPFGSTVRQVPFALKEVLLFQGSVRTGSAHAGESRGGELDEQECFSDSGAPFHLRGIEADDYVLCFFHDRFHRAEAVLRLPKDAPPDTFARWCEEWLAGLSDTERNADHCAGHEQDTLFDATLAYDTEIAGPLLTVVVADQPTRELYEQRQKEREEKNPAPPKP